MQLARSQRITGRSHKVSSNQQHGCFILGRPLSSRRPGPSNRYGLYLAHGATVAPLASELYLDTFKFNADGLVTAVVQVRCSETKQEDSDFQGYGADKLCIAARRYGRGPNAGLCRPCGNTGNAADEARSAAPFYKPYFLGSVYPFAGAPGWQHFIVGRGANAGARARRPVITSGSSRCM